MWGRRTSRGLQPSLLSAFYRPSFAFLAIHLNVVYAPRFSCFLTSSMDLLHHRTRRYTYSLSLSCFAVIPRPPYSRVPPRFFRTTTALMRRLSLRHRASYRFVSCCRLLRFAVHFAVYAVFRGISSRLQCLRYPRIPLFPLFVNCFVSSSPSFIILYL